MQQLGGGEEILGVGETEYLEMSPCPSLLPAASLPEAAGSGAVVAADSWSHGPAGVPLLLWHLSVERSRWAVELGGILLSARQEEERGDSRPGRWNPAPAPPPPGARPAPASPRWEARPGPRCPQPA